MQFQQGSVLLACLVTLGAALRRELKLLQVGENKVCLQIWHGAAAFGGPMDVIEDQDLSSCAVQCVANDRCLSFNFVPDTSECLLYPFYQNEKPKYIRKNFPESSVMNVEVLDGEACGIVVRSTTETSTTSILPTATDTTTVEEVSTQEEPVTESEDTEPPCQDLDKRCKQWKKDDQCRLNPLYMHYTCQKSCKTCGSKRPDSFCQDSNAQCLEWASDGECDNNLMYMRMNCQKSCDSCGVTYDTILGELDDFGGTCKNTVDNCNVWVYNKQCQENPVWMKEFCCLGCAHEDKFAKYRKDGEIRITA